MRALAVGALVLLAVSAGPALGARRPDKPRIDALEASRVGERVEVSFRVANAVEEETLERIQAGLEVHHRHRIELLARRSVPLWTAKLLARIRVDTTAIYDSLTQRFVLTRTVRTGPNPQTKWVVVDERRHSTTSVEELVSWMTGFGELPALTVPDAAGTARLRVRVESTLGRRFVFYMFPARLKLTAERRLGDG